MPFLDKARLKPLPCQSKASPRSGGKSVPNSVLIECIRAGEELHDATTQLAYRGFTLGQLEALMDESAAKDTDSERWEARRKDLARLVKTGAKKRTRRDDALLQKMPPPPKPKGPKRAKADPQLDLPTIDAKGFADRPYRARDWIVDILIPRGETTLVYGPGSAGKSLLLYQLALGVASGTTWLKRDMAKGRVAFFTCEDSADELKRRGEDILRSLGIQWRNLGDRLLVIPMRDSEATAVLASQGRDGRLVTTPTYEALRRVLQAFEPDVVIIDTLADTFAGNENDRSHAKQFVKMIEGLVRATFIVTAHPSVTGQQDGRGSSGSTGWPAAVRSHLYMVRDDKDDDIRRLTLKKANYSKLGEGDVLMRWEDGVFRAVSRMEVLDAAHEAENLFLRLLGEYRDQGRYLNPSAGENYAPSVFALDEETKAAGLSRSEMRDAMNRLLRSGQIVIAMRGPPSRQTQFLELVEDDSEPSTS